MTRLTNQAGLPTVIAAIRGKDRSADQIDEMIGRAQWFYFTRYVIFTFNLFYITAMIN